MINLTKDCLQAAINEHRDRKSVANTLQLSLPTLDKYLKQFGLKCLPKVQHPEVDEAWLRQNWVATEDSIHTVAEKFNISESLLEARILKFNLTKKYKHSLNLTKLFDLQDPHIWYLAGFFATDGHFSKKHDMVTVELVGDSEFKLLNEFKTYYESTQPVKQYFHNEKTFHTDGVHTNYWQISADNLKEFFIDNFGIVLENKTWNVDVPKNFPTEDCAKAYIRGCIDGDGYIAISPCLVTLCTASEKFIKGVGEIVKQYTDIEYRFTYTPRSDNREFPMVDWKANRAKQLLDWVYSLDDCFKLERKYQRYLNYYQTNSKKDV